MRAVTLIGRSGSEEMIMHRRPFGALNVNMRAGKQPLGSRIVSDRRLAPEQEKNDMTEPMLRTTYAGCPTLPVHVASNTDRSLGRMASGSTKSLAMDVANAMLTMVAPASNALWTVS